MMTLKGMMNAAVLCALTGTLSAAASSFARPIQDSSSALDHGSDPQAPLTDAPPVPAPETPVPASETPVATPVTLIPEGFADAECLQADPLVSSFNGIYSNDDGVHAWATHLLRALPADVACAFDKRQLRFLVVRGDNEALLGRGANPGIFLRAKDGKIHPPVVGFQFKSPQIDLDLASAQGDIPGDKWVQPGNTLLIRESAVDRAVNEEPEAEAELFAILIHEMAHAWLQVLNDEQVYTQSGSPIANTEKNANLLEIQWIADLLEQSDPFNELANGMRDIMQDGYDAYCERRLAVYELSDGVADYLRWTRTERLGLPAL